MPSCCFGLCWRCAPSHGKQPCQGRGAPSAGHGRLWPGLRQQTDRPVFGPFWLLVALPAEGTAKPSIVTASLGTPSWRRRAASSPPRCGLAGQGGTLCLAVSGGVRTGGGPLVCVESGCHDRRRVALERRHQRHALPDSGLGLEQLRPGLQPGPGPAGLLAFLDRGAAGRRTAFGPASLAAARHNTSAVMLHSYSVLLFGFFYFSAFSTKTTWLTCWLCSLWPTASKKLSDDRAP